LGLRLVQRSPPHGTSTIAVRTHSGATFINTSRANSQLDDDLDNLNWDMVGEVKSWRA
jgi:hypothetical protein